MEKALIEANGEDLEVEINSGGGDVYSGSEIYTALKGYSGNVIVKIVGVAASAAGVIAMSGKKVLISPTAQFMMHNVSSTARGDYRVMEHSAEVLKNYNTSIANAYILKTGMKQEDLLSLMDKETWLNAQKAVEYGFADEVMFDTGNQLVASMSGFVLPPEVINKIRNLAIQQKNSPDNTGQQAGLNFAQSTQLPQEPALKPQPVNQNKEDDGTVEIKNINELRQHFPDLCNQLEAAAREEGVKNERQRINAIDQISQTLAPELVAKAKYEEPMTAEQLAFEAIRADASRGRQYMNDLEADNAASGAQKVAGNPQTQQTEKEKEEAERSSATDYIAQCANQKRGFKKE